MSDAMSNQISKDGENVIHNLIDDVATLKAREIPLSASDISAKIQRTTNQSINNLSNTAIIFDSAIWDNGGLWNVAQSTRLTAPVDGIYLATGSVAFAYNNVGVRRMQLSRSGVVIGSDYRNTNASSSTEIVFSCQAKFTAGQYLELYVFQNSGGALNVSQLADRSPRMTLTYLGEIA